MKRLVVFGDSYSCEPSPGFPALETTWHYRLAQQNGMEYKNYALSGTNLSWSIDQYFQYLVTDRQPHDGVIFVLTLPERLWFQDMEHPRDGNIGSDKPNTWRDGNKSLIEYLLLHTPESVNGRARLEKALVLKGCSHLHSLVVLLDGADDRRHYPHKDLVFRESKKLFYPDWSLGQISKSEFSSKKEWRKNVEAETVRANHLNKASHDLVLSKLQALVDKVLPQKGLMRSLE